VTAVFLRMNGFRLEVSADDAEKFIVERLIVHRAAVDEIEAWLEQRMRRA
jgi:prophage maintenance system killer protein